MTTENTLITNPVQVSTVISLGASDLTGLMVQRHLDGLTKEENELMATRKACWTELELSCAERNRLIQEAFDRKKAIIDTFLSAYAQLVPGKWGKLKARPILLPPEKSVILVFGPYMANFRYGVYVDHESFEYKVKDWDGVWIMSPKGYLGYRGPENNMSKSSEDSKEASDDGDEEVVGTFTDSFTNQQLTALKVKVPKAWRARITLALREMSRVDRRLTEISTARKDMPNLERKVAAAMTERFLRDQPELVSRINDALNATGSPLLLGVG